MSPRGVDVPVLVVGFAAVRARDAAGEGTLLRDRDVPGEPGFPEATDVPDREAVGVTTFRVVVGEAGFGGVGGGGESDEVVCFSGGARSGRDSDTVAVTRCLFRDRLLRRFRVPPPTPRLCIAEFANTTDWRRTVCAEDTLGYFTRPSPPPLRCMVPGRYWLSSS